MFDVWDYHSESLCDSNAFSQRRVRCVQRPELVENLGQHCRDGEHSPRLFWRTEIEGHLTQTQVNTLSERGHRRRIVRQAVLDDDRLAQMYEDARPRLPFPFE